MNEIIKIKISEIDDFKNHPYKVELGDELNDLVESIKLNGLLVPIVVRRKENDRYELLSGHRRKKVYEILGLEEIDAIIKDLNDDESTIFMVDSNMYREKLLPSEKAFAYRMKMETMKHQGKTSCHYDTKLRSDEKLSEKSNDSARQIQRYIRLTELIKELLDMVDIGKISFNPAVEISYLSKEEQYMLLDCIKRYDATPSQSQAIFLKKLSQENKLTTEKMEEIMQEEKPNQQPKYSINYNRFEKYLPRNVVTKKEVEDFLFKCVEEHYKRLKQRDFSR